MNVFRSLIQNICYFHDTKLIIRMWRKKLGMEKRGMNNKTLFKTFFKHIKCLIHIEKAHTH